MTAPNSNGDARHELAEQLLDLEIKHAAVFARQDELKEGLREISTSIDAGFTVDLTDKGKGKVTVGKGSEEKLKGILPELDPEKFLALPKKRQESLTAQGLVSMVQQRSKARKPSVSTKPILPAPKPAAK